MNKEVTVSFMNLCLFTLATVATLSSLQSVQSAI